jgi:glycosyltransferase involved in cell wall biosynthesis
MHSILIPHRNRNAWLDLCIWSILRSAYNCAVSQYEVVIADNGSDTVPVFDDPRVRVIVDESPMPIFNKPRLLNIALDSVEGDVLTWLDCDMIVGKQWMDGAKYLYEPFRPGMPSSAIVRVCYRVRRLPEDLRFPITNANGREKFVDALFADYDALDDRGEPKYPRGWEAYRKVEMDRFDEQAFTSSDVTEWIHYIEGDRQVRQPVKGWAKGAIFGNSQWSIRRDALGDIRGDERYEGRGFEDIEIIERIRQRCGDKYVGYIRYDADCNLFHVGHPYAADWFSKQETDGIVHNPRAKANCERWKELRDARV